MKRYIANAFTYPDKIENRKVVGNPASVFVCKDKFPSKEEMRKIAIEEDQPVSVFIKKKKNGNKEFNVRYFFPNGKELSICGHGSLASAKIIHKLFNYNNITLIPNRNLSKNNIGLLINGDIVSLTLPTYIPKILNKKILKEKTFQLLLDSLGLHNKDIYSLFLFEETTEYVLEIDVNKLRNLNIDFKKLSEICKKLECLSIFITAKSNLKDFDYEVRVFAPHCNLDEDIVCGSANSVLIPFWSDRLNKTNFKVLFPYRYKQGLIGGVVNIKYDKAKNNIRLSGKVNYGKSEE